MLSGPLPAAAFAGAAAAAGFAPPAGGADAAALPLGDSAAMTTAGGFSPGALTAADAPQPSTDPPPMTGARTRVHCARVSRASTSVLPSKVPRSSESGLGPANRSVPLATTPARATAAGEPPVVWASATGAATVDTAGACCAAGAFVGERGSGVAVCADIGTAVPVRSAARTVVFGVGSLTIAAGGSLSPPSSRLQAQSDNASAKASAVLTDEARSWLAP